MSAIHPILVMLSLTPYFTLVAGVEELDVVYSITRSSLAVSLAPGEGGMIITSGCTVFLCLVMLHSKFKLLLLFIPAVITNAREAVQ